MNKHFINALQIGCVFLLFFIISNADMIEPKRYSKEQGLIPFPRVGRQEAALKLAKLRNELYAFPRIGRSQPLDMKRNGAKTMNTGLWFGPRLGRVQKRNPFTADMDDYYNSVTSDVRPMHFAPQRYTHESDEESDQMGQPLLEDS